MIRTADHKYWLMRSKKHDGVKRYFYDLHQDRLEEHNLAGRVVQPDEARLATALDEWRAQRRDLEPAIPVEISDEDRRQLEALGYVQ